MDHEVELNYRLTGHLQQGERVLATLISSQHGIYAATDRRILGLNNARIGYCLRIHAYADLERVECISDGKAWAVRFMAGRRELAVRARSATEARMFARAASERLARATAG